jgi:hypothetical protein
MPDAGQAFWSRTMIRQSLAWLAFPCVSGRCFHVQELGMYPVPRIDALLRRSAPSRAGPRSAGTSLVNILCRHFQQTRRDSPKSTGRHARIVWHSSSEKHWANSMKSEKGQTSCLLTRVQRRRTSSALSSNPSGSGASFSSSKIGLQ